MSVLRRAYASPHVSKVPMPMANAESVNGTWALTRPKEKDGSADCHGPTIDANSSLQIDKGRVIVP